MKSSPPKRGPDKLRILMVTAELPYPPVRGGASRAFNFLKRLAARGHEIVLLSFASDEEKSCAAALEAICAEVWLINRRGGMLGRLANIDRNMLSALRAAAGKFDLVHFERTHMGVYGWFLSRKVKKILVQQDLVWLTAWQLARSRESLLSKLEGYLKAAASFFADIITCSRFDAVAAVSDRDAAFLDFFLRRKKRVRVVPNGVDLEADPYIGSLGGGKDLMFCGDFRHPPNIEAILYFAREIYPLVKKASKETKLFVAGAMPPKQVQDLVKIDGVNVLGFVEDLDPLYRSCKVAIAPIKSGCGTRIKILEAMARGMPVVSTSAGCRGIEVSGGEHLLIGDSPADFASHILKLLDDSTLRERLRENSRRLVEERYDYDKLLERLEGVYLDVLGRR